MREGSVPSPLSPVPLYFSSLSLLCTALHYLNAWNRLALTIQFNLKIVWTQSKYYSIEYLSVKRTKQV